MGKEKRVQHRWTEVEDLVLLKLVAAKRPTNVKMWDSMLVLVNSDEAISAVVTRRAIKERFELLVKNHKKETSHRLAQ